MLCSKCQEKIRSGEVDGLYMKVAQFLLDIEGQYPVLQTARLAKVIEVGGFLVGGKLTRDLGDNFRRRVLVVEEGVNDRGFLEDLFSNQRIVTINIIWLPDGSTETRAVLQGGRRTQRLSKKRIRALTEIAKRVRNMDLRVEYSY
jgi:hypothetical protein